MKIKSVMSDSGIQEAGRLTSEQVAWVAGQRVSLRGVLEVGGVEGRYRVDFIGEELMLYSVDAELARKELDPGDVIWGVFEQFSGVAEENYRRFRRYGAGCGMRHVGYQAGEPVMLSLRALEDDELVDFLRLEERGLGVQVVDDVVEVGSPGQDVIRIDTKRVDTALLALSQRAWERFDDDDVALMARVAQYCVELVEAEMSNIQLLERIEQDLASDLDDQGEPKKWWPTCLDDFPSTLEEPVTG